IVRVRTMRIGCAAILVLTFGAHAQTDWPVYGRDPGGMRYSPLKQINARNVTKLQLAWSYDTQAAIPQAAAAAPPPSEGSGPVAPGGGGRGGAGRGAAPRQRRSESTPLVIAGVMYLATGYSRILALEPETGRKIWE